jgi:hypothetical protein
VSASIDGLSGSQTNSIRFHRRFYKKEAKNERAKSHLPENRF